MSFKYIFTGITHPQRANITLPKLKCEFKEISQNMEGTVESSCINSIVTVTVEITFPMKDNMGLTYVRRPSFSI
jgi:hypothetical protein